MSTEIGTGGPAPATSGPGSTANLVELTGDRPAATIEEVAQRLTAIRDRATSTSPLGENDGIAAFSKLYQVITERIGGMAAGGDFRAADFLVRLDIEFSERYFNAIRHYAVDVASAPKVWRVLFDNRSDGRVEPVNFAMAGVNAHINFDLSAALVTTWRRIAPDGQGESGPQFYDYRLVNEVFEAEMDELREDLDSPLSGGPDGAPWDVGANWMADLVVRFTRDLAWNEADRVWDRGATPEVVAESEARLDTMAAFLGAHMLRLPLPV